MRKIVILLFCTAVIFCLFCNEEASAKSPSFNSNTSNNYFTEEDVILVAKVIYLENGGGSLKTRALTAIALVNRAYYCPWCPNTVYECVMQKAGKYWQYASITRKGILRDDIPLTKSNLRIARKALSGGYKTPHNMIYQGRSWNGKRYWESKDGEKFGCDTGWN